MTKPTPCQPATNGCCPPKPTPRETLSAEQALALTVLFKMLGNETRLRLLHALLQNGEMHVTALAEAVAMKPQAVSNQLQRLADRQVVATRRAGTTLFYRIVDPCVAELFERALCLLEDATTGVHLRGSP